MDHVLECQKIYALECAGTMIKIVCLVEASSDLSPTASITKMYPNFQQKYGLFFKHKKVSILLAVLESTHT